MLFKRARELVSDVFQSFTSGSSTRETNKCQKILKAIDDNSIDNLRTLLNQLATKDVEDYLRRPIDSMRRTPLHFAAWAENTEILEILLSYVNEVDIEDKTGATPIMLVIGSGHDCLKKIQLFISKHADVNRKDKSGWTLLHAAVQSRKREILEVLVSNGANIHLVDGQNRTLLHIACDIGDVSLVKYLLEKGVSVKAVDKNGWTPLHIACGPADDHELVHHLIQKGADPWARDLNQHTPLHMASQFQAKKVEFYLRTLNDLSSDTETDDLSSEFGIMNDTYESDNVFESEPPSNRVSHRSTQSMRLVQLAFQQTAVVKL